MNKRDRFESKLRILIGGFLIFIIRFRSFEKIKKIEKLYFLQKTIFKIKIKNL